MTQSQTTSKSPVQQDCDPDTPHARRIDPGSAQHDPLSPADHTSEDRQQALIDEGIEETFPASDPVSVKRVT